MSRRSLDLVDYGCCWVRDNPEKFKKIMALAHRQAARGERLQRGNVYTLAQQAGMTVSGVDELKRDHNLWSVLARYMVMLRPGLARCLDFRRSEVDEVDMAARWHDLVNPRTAFLAGSWKEAKSACESGDASADEGRR